MTHTMTCWLIAIAIPYLLIAFAVAIYCGVDAAMSSNGKLRIDDMVPVVLFGILWPFILAFLAVFGIGFLLKWMCEKIAQAIMRFKARTPSKVGLENTIKKL